MIAVPLSEARRVAGHVAALCGAFVSATGRYPAHEDGSLGAVHWLALRAVRQQQEPVPLLRLTVESPDGGEPSLVVARGFWTMGGSA